MNILHQALERLFGEAQEEQSPEFGISVCIYIYIFFFLDIVKFRLER